MRRIALLIVAVCMLAMQKGDAVPSARASICGNSDCTRTSQQGFAPAIVRVSYFVPVHAENRHAQFGLVCEEYESVSAWQLDGEQEKIPSWIVTYRDVPAGQCRPAIVVIRRDGSQQSARGDPVLILSRD